MSEVHAQFTAGMDSKQFEASVNQMSATMATSSKKIVSEIDKTGQAATTAGRRAANAMGQIGMQMQDIGVQIQMGTKASTIILQQGTQIASAFGTSGAIAGGVAALIVAVYAWKTGQADVTKEMAKATAQAKEMEKAAKKAMEMLREDTMAGDVAEEHAKHGKDAADEKKRELEFAKKIAEIQSNPNLTGDVKQALTEAAFRRKTQEEIARKGDEMFAGRSAAFKAEDELAKMAESPQDKMNRLVAEIGDRAPDLDLKDPIARDKARKAIAEKMADLAKTAQEENGKADKDREKSQEKFARMQEKELDRVSKFAEKQEKIAGLEDQLAKEKEKEKIIEGAKAGQEILDSIENQKNGLSSADIRKADIKKASDENRAIAREIAKKDNARRAAGLGGMSQEEKRKMREKMHADIEAAKNKNKLLAAIEEKDMDKLSVKIADEIKKLLVK